MLALNNVDFQHTTYTLSKKEMEGLCKALNMYSFRGVYFFGITVLKVVEQTVGDAFSQGTEGLMFCQVVVDGCDGDHSLPEGRYV